MDIGNRLLRLLKATAADKVDSVVQILDQGASFIDETLKEWERKQDLEEKSGNRQKTSSKRSFGFDGSSERHRQGTRQKTYQKDSNYRQTDFKYGAPYTSKVLDDLNLFGLKPPTTFDEIKKARNREIKKFHPDRFMNEPEKMETAKKILQIYNAAYERLKLTFQSKSR